MSDEMVVHEQANSIAVFAGSPKDVIAKASEIATALADVVRRTGMVIAQGDGATKREYVMVEGWNVLGAMTSLLPTVEWTRKSSDEPIVWEARVSLVNGAGRIVATAESMASGAERTYKNASRKCPECDKETLVFFKEAKGGQFRGKPSYWCGTRDGGCSANFAGDDRRITEQVVGKVEMLPPWAHSEFSIRSMAQTRATGKVYRLALSWIMKMAGFEPTPAEEMPNLEVDAGPVAPKPPAPRPAAAAVQRDEKLAKEANASVAKVLDEAKGAAPTEAPVATDGDPRSLEDRALSLESCTTPEVESILASLSLATKGVRKFYEIMPRPKGGMRTALVDTKILVAIGSVKQGAPSPVWIDNLLTSVHGWPAFCRQMVAVGDELGVDVTRRAS